MEYLIYQQMEYYKDELPDDAIKKWTPRQLISEMLTVDPYADQSSTIAIYPEKSSGEGGYLLGDDKRFTLKWANKNYNALSNFLHAANLHQLYSGNLHSHENILEKAQDIIKVIEDKFSSHIFGNNFGVFYNLECLCGRKFNRRQGSFREEDGIICPSCGAIHDIVRDDTAIGGKFSYKRRQILYKCLSCETDNYIDAHKISFGKIIVCTKCGNKVKIIFALEQLNGK